MCIEPGLVVDGYKFLREVEEDNYANVWHVQTIRDDAVLIAKVMKIRGQVIEQSWRLFDSEVECLMKVNHRNIVRVFGCFRYESNFVLVLENCQGKSLHEMIRKNGRLKGQVLVGVIKDICSALNCAWSHCVFHRDMNPLNVRIDGNGITKVTGFGLSIIQNGSVIQVREVLDLKASMACAPPEVVKRVSIDPMSTDIWSTGVTILWIARGFTPWHFYNAKDLNVMITQGNYIVPNGMDPMVERLTRKMLVMNADERVFPSDGDLNLLAEPIHVINPLLHRPSETSMMRSVGVFQLNKGLNVKQPLHLEVQHRARLNSDNARAHVSSEVAGQFGRMQRIRTISKPMYT